MGISRQRIVARGRDALQVGKAAGALARHDGIGREISQALRVAAGESGDAANQVQGRQQIHQAQQVPQRDLGEFQAQARQHGLLYPPDPASLAECSLGGNVATNAGGPRCLKYGVTRNYVLGLQVALADGTLVRVGGRTVKNKSGFDLVGIFVGSEGLLGLVTEITLRLLPAPPSRAVLAASFASASVAAACVQHIFREGFLPSALELADRFFARYGDWAVFIARLLPVIRTFIAFPAGVSRMNVARFHLYTFLGSLPWCLALAYAGLKLGERWMTLRWPGSGAASGSI